MRLVKQLSMLEETTIHKAIDLLYNDMRRRPLSLIDITEFVPEEMRDYDMNNPYGPDYVGWKMTSSTITDIDIRRAKSELGVNLPTEYIHFVRYKHFIELYSHNGSIRFSRITNNNKLDDIIQNNIDNFYHPSVLHQRYIAIADFYDYGSVLLNSDPEDSNVYVAMYDDIDRKIIFKPTFVDILSLDKEYSDYFITNYNKLWWK